ncbi:hypothetical protein L3Y34_016993 [Caenorhabditis briggsae]|uniref:Uncharacterized protein n=1 Tax=Caenorhabditis briggsae TaxID=6238 RepID=A0AAE9DGH0_CAEBR|nr:hypothetical protein L3Y34_016993 [Caenorhabditis briggsae]
MAPQQVDLISLKATSIAPEIAPKNKIIETAASSTQKVIPIVPKIAPHDQKIGKATLSAQQVESSTPKAEI